MKKLKEFIWLFCRVLSCDVILSDLGIIVLTAGWTKYIIPVGMGLTWALYIQPKNAKRKFSEF